jgi:hypothetical protein
MKANLASSKRDRDSTGSTVTTFSEISYKNSIENKIEDFDSESSSTEKPSKMLKSPMIVNNMRQKNEPAPKLPISISTTQHDGSDEDATLNEIGKFDESYVYEKENDFLR